MQQCISKPDSAGHWEDTELGGHRAGRTQELGGHKSWEDTELGGHRAEALTLPSPADGEATQQRS